MRNAKDISKFTNYITLAIRNSSDSATLVKMCSNCIVINAEAVNQKTSGAELSSVFRLCDAYEPKTGTCNSLLLRFEEFDLVISSITRSNSLVFRIGSVDDTEYGLFCQNREACYYWQLDSSLGHLNGQNVAEIRIRLKADGAATGCVFRFEQESINVGFDSTYNFEE